jgi:hypothetical protein
MSADTVPALLVVLNIDDISAGANNATTACTLR